MKMCRNTILSNRDTEVLLFLWKYRLATFQAIKARFFASGSSRRAYDRIRKLQSGEFVVQEKITGTRNRVWCLGKRGFNYLSGNVLPDLKTNRFRPHQQYHDLIASSALLGEWLVRIPPKVKIVSEQQLKSMELPELSKMFPTDMEHHPDGIWLFASGKEKTAVALEVELSAKSSKRYEQVCAFYSSNTAFENVIWIVKSPEHGNQILEASRRHGIPREGIHLFVTLDQFKAHIWQSPIRNNTLRGFTMGKVLQTLATGNKLSHSGLGVNVGSTGGQIEVKKTTTSPLLDFNFKLGKSTFYANQDAKNS